MVPVTSDKSEIRERRCDIRGLRVLCTKALPFVDTRTKAVP